MKDRDRVPSSKSEKSPNKGADATFFSGDKKWGLARVFLLVITVVTGVIASFLVTGGWRYLLTLFAAIMLAFFAGIRYLRQIYELDGFWQGFRTVFSSFTSILYPHMTVSHGKIAKEEGEELVLERIGGPGYVTVRLGNAVLFEGQDAPTSIQGKGYHFIPRFETVQPIALEPQYGEIDKLTAMTRDGFYVQVQNTRFRFRLSADPAERSKENPYPYSKDAIFDMVYNRTVSEKGLSDWVSGVTSDVRKVLAGYINRHTLDQLTAPEESGADPRGEIRTELFSTTMTEKIHGRGAELLWVDIGNFIVGDEKVEKQRLSTWQAKWMGDVRLSQSYGDAQRLAYQEIGRAEAQAEILISIMHALSDVNLKGGTQQTVRNVFLIRTAQLLEAMGNTPGDAKTLPAGGESGKGK
jgi:hypothetical protein